MTAVSGLLVKINDVDVTAKVQSRTVKWNSRLNERTPLSFTYMDTSGPPPYDEVIAGQSVELQINAVKVFGGSIERVREVEPTKDEGLFVSVSCVDHTHILDRFVVAKKYESVNAGDIVKNIVDDFIDDDESLTTVGVQTGVTISKVVFGYKRAFDCMRELADLIGFGVYVDKDKDLKFFDRSTFGAPISITPTSDNYRNLKVERSRKKYRNKQFIRAGFDTTNLKTELHLGDTKLQNFELVFPVAGSPVAAPTVEVDTGGGGFVAKSIGIRGVDDDTAFEWYYRAQEKNISQREGDTPLALNQTLRVVYRGLFPIIVLRSNAAGILSRATIEDNSGIYESVVDDKSIESSDFAEEKGDALLRKYDIPTIISFDTAESGLLAGQLLPVNLPDRSQDGDLTSAEYLIESVSLIDQGTNVRYAVRALSGEYLGSWQAYYRKVRDASRDYSLREGEKLQLLGLTEEDAELTETFTTADALVDEDDDPYTGCRAGTGTVGKSFIGAPPL